MEDYVIYDDHEPMDETEDNSPINGYNLDSLGLSESDFW